MLDSNKYQCVIVLFKEAFLLVQKGAYSGMNAYYKLLLVLRDAYSGRGGSLAVDCYSISYSTTYFEVAMHLLYDGYYKLIITLHFRS